MEVEGEEEEEERVAGWMGVCRRADDQRARRKSGNSRCDGRGELVFSLRRQVGWGGEDETELRRASHLSDRDALR